GPPRTLSARGSLIGPPWGFADVDAFYIAAGRRCTRSGPWKLLLDYSMTWDRRRTMACGLLLSMYPRIALPRLSNRSLLASVLVPPPGGSFLRPPAQPA